MLLIIMKLNRGQKTKTEGHEKHPNQAAFQMCNIIKLGKPKEHLGGLEKRPTQDTLQMCNAIRSGKLKEYLGELEKRPKKKITSKFLGIIYSKTVGLPILFDEEISTVIIDGISFDPIQNVQARMMTKITLLLTVESESKKLGIWNQLQPRWTEKYIMETKAYVQIIDAIVKHCENTRQEDKVIDLRNSIKLIKEVNQQYAIDW
jgi:hypothetical protein